MGDAMLVKKRPVSIDEINLKSIQRLDPCAVAIVDKAVHAALYQFDKCRTQWVKTAIEGPLFLYKRADKPLHSLMIANRQSVEDHIEPITSPLRFFLETPYLFMNTQEGEIRGFWFFEEEDCTRLYKLLVKLASGSSPSTSTNINNSKRAVSVNSQNGYSAHSNTAAGRDSRCKKLDQMPALLQQLLSQQTTAKLPDVPIRGALNADEIERQLILRGAKGEGDMISTQNKSLAKVMGKRASASEENEDDISNLVNNLSLCAASSSLKDVEKQRSKGKNEHDGTSKDDISQVASLTKDQLLVALKHLLKDDGFVTRLHHAYLDSINTRLGLRD
ncbi:Dcp1-like decapping family protein [Onchocerca flexuosa]|uniref:Dcp1-like decapping family protein n=1 Tax=Onchocerca flexuosa TaxID=387005 RepID=A0A238BWZ3_9BILA|nr:Dcp1-like decapping family protein [Onchocerca flexuosa]